jgi:hypothetical protein
LRQLERTGYHDGRVSFELDKNRIEYENGRKQTIHIVVVESRFQQLEAEAVALD